MGRVYLSTALSVIVQDEKWFDRPENAASRIVQVLVKDGEDARDLVAVVWGQCCVVFSMLCVGLVWAFITGWQVTLCLPYAYYPDFTTLFVKDNTECTYEMERI